MRDGIGPADFDQRLSSIATGKRLFSLMPTVVEKRRITYLPSELPKSGLYSSLLPKIMAK